MRASGHSFFVVSAVLHACIACVEGRARSPRSNLPAWKERGETQSSFKFVLEGHRGSLLKVPAHTPLFHADL